MTGHAPSRKGAAAGESVPHDHAEFVPGCFRCELGRDEAAQEDAALGGIGPEIRDGHKLVVGLGRNYTLDVDVVCPQDDTRRCKWQDGKHIEAHGPCWLRYLVKDSGPEFLEWWTAGGPERVDLTAGPIEIEWWVDGGDEPEVWWRPVAQEVLADELPSDAVDPDQLREAVRQMGAVLDEAAETAEDPERTVERLTDLVLKAQVR